MHKTAKHWLLSFAVGATASGLSAQPPTPPAPAPMTAPTVQAQGANEIEPGAEFLSLQTNTTDNYVVRGYKLLPGAYSTNPSVATLSLPGRTGEAKEFPDAFSITTLAPGTTTLVLNLINPVTQETRSMRLEVLVVDEVSLARKRYLEALIKRLFPTTNVSIEFANSRTVIANGFVDRAELVQPIIDLIERFVGAGPAPSAGGGQQGGGQPGSGQQGGQPAGNTPNVVNALRVVGAQQVQLKVVIAEVNRTKARELGFAWSWTDLSGPLTASLTNQVADGGIIALQPFTLTRAGVYNFQGTLRALVSNSLGKILAEPTLVTTSGQPAFFNVGGEVPIVTPQTGSNSGGVVFTIEYRPFGTNLRFVPTVLGDGRIRLEVRPEVSSRNNDNNIVINGFAIPGFNSRVAETTVELENGQSFAIAGLIDQKVNATRSKTPILGDLPIVGWAWQTKRYEQIETELVILVTPHLVDAMDERVCKLPGRESRHPNDWEFYLGSKFEPPCFDDPYRNHYQKHFNDVAIPPPVPVGPYDNYGRSPYARPAPMPPQAMPVPAEAAPAAPAQPTAFETIEAPAQEVLQPVDHTMPVEESQVVPPPPGSAGAELPPTLPATEAPTAPVTEPPPAPEKSDPVEVVPEPAPPVSEK